jgi:hypothetical protein
MTEGRWSQKGNHSLLIYRDHKAKKALVLFSWQTPESVYKEGWDLCPSDSPQGIVVATWLNRAGTKVRTEGSWDPDTRSKDTGQELWWVHLVHWGGQQDPRLHDSVFGLSLTCHHQLQWSTVTWPDIFLPVVTGVNACVAVCHTGEGELIHLLCFLWITNIEVSYRLSMM